MMPPEQFCNYHGFYLQAEPKDDRWFTITIIDETRSLYKSGTRPGKTPYPIKNKEFFLTRGYMKLFDKISDKLYQ